MARVDECVAQLEQKGYLKQKRLLDVGCGEGYLLEKAQEAGAIVTGLEPNKAVCKRLQQRGLRVEQVFAEDYPLGEQFDLITLFWVLDATRNPVAVLRKMRALLAPEGVLVVQLASVYNVSLVIQRPMDRIIKTQRNATDYHPFYFTRASLAACLASAGFTIIDKPRKYSTNNFFVARVSAPKDLSAVNPQNWRSLYLFFFFWRLRDWILINRVTALVYRHLDLRSWKERIKRWLLA